MVYYDLKVAVILKEDIKYENTYEVISNFIASAMLFDEKTKELHEENRFKLYNFCSFYPFEKDGMYQKGKMYSFDIKFVDITFAIKMKQFLSMAKSKFLQVAMTDIKTYEYKKINKLITLTPCIITTLKGDYKINNDMELVRKRIMDGIDKKYELIYHEKVTGDFIQEIVKTNRCDIKLPYKNIFFLGNKFEIIVKEDELSQKLAYIALSTGVLEKNSQGYRIL